MSAQDTLFRHCGSLSTAALAFITVLNPSSFSVMPSGLRHSSSPAGLISITDASQPLIHRSQEWRHGINQRSQALVGVSNTSTIARTLTAQSWKKSRSVAGAASGESATDCCTAPRTMLSRFGHTPA
jgi:hypothetical protein